MIAATIAAIAVATHPAAGVLRRSVQRGLRGGLRVSQEGDSEESIPASSVGCSSVVASAVGSCSRMSEASSIVSLCAFAVSIASESSGPIVLKGAWRTSALALGENVQSAPLENYSLFWL